MTTSHPAHTLLVLPAAIASQVHADLVSAVAPMGERHFDTRATHTADTPKIAPTKSEEPMI